MQDNTTTTSSVPGDNAKIAIDREGDDVCEALLIAVEHVRSTAWMVESSLEDAIDEGQLMIPPGILASTLNGIGAHLAIITALVERIHYGQEERS